MNKEQVEKSVTSKLAFWSS